MREMKDSGVAWIGEIPVDWSVIKCKYISSFISGYSFDSSDFQLEYKYPVIRIGDISNGTINLSKCIGVNYCNGLENYRVNENDLLLAMSGATVGKIGIVKDSVDAYINQRVGIIRTKIPFFLYYSLVSGTFLEYIILMANGSAQPNVSGSVFGDYYITKTTDEEAIRISSWLDNLCNKADALIVNQEQQIEKLKAYKQSLITEVVTKGLNPDAPMKDSGVEWIGEIPEHWSTIKIKFTSWLKGRIGWDGLTSSEFIDDGPYLITGTDFYNGGINWETCVHITEKRFEEDELLHIREDDLLITKDGTIGKLAIVKNCPKKVSLNSGVMIIRNTTNFKYYDKYLYYVLQSNQFYLWYELSQSGNSTIKHLYQGQFYEFEYTYPTVQEQQQISDYLDEKCAAVDRLIEIKQQKIEKLNDYKKSLIYEYVTGKKEVV